jgi:hypothetical protein
MVAKLKVDQLETVDGTGIITVNNPLAGDGASLTGLNATNLGSGTVPTARLGTGTADADSFLRGDGAWEAAGGTNTPSFLVYNPSNTEIADETYTKIQLQSEVFDTDTCYDNSTNYRFTPDVAGKYFFFGATQTQETEDYNDAFTLIYKNGSQAYLSNSPHLHYHTNQVSGVIDMNGSSDYVELYMHNNTSGGATTITTSASTTYFGGFRLL